MIVVGLIVLVAVIMICFIAKDPYNHDRILGYSFVITCMVVVGGLGIYYCHNNYIYSTETREEVSTIEILEIQDGKYFKHDAGKEKYYYYKKEDSKLNELSEDDVEVQPVSGEPYIAVVKVVREYDVESHPLFNWMITFRFRDYTEVEKLYVLYANSVHIMK